MKLTGKCEIGLCTSLMQEIRKKATSNCCFNIIKFTLQHAVEPEETLWFVRNACRLLITGENTLFFSSTKRQILISLWATKAVIIIVIAMQEWSKPRPVIQDFNRSMAIPSAKGIHFKAIVKDQERGTDLLAKKSCQKFQQNMGIVIQTVMPIQCLNCSLPPALIILLCILIIYNQYLYVVKQVSKYN